MSTDVPIANVATRPLRADAHQMQRVDQTGIEELCAMVESGRTVAEIARTLGVNESVIYRWLDRFGHRESFTRAMQASAEALADRALQRLESADGTSNSDVNLAKAIDNHLRWRAGTRNSRYAERANVEVTGKDGGPIQSQVVVYVPSNGRDERVIDAEPAE